MVIVKLPGGSERAQRGSPSRVPVGRGGPAATGPGTRRPTREDLLRLQRSAGNAAVGSMLQRQSTPAPAPPVTPAPPVAPPLRRLPPVQHVFTGPRFDMRYVPVPLPEVGQATVTLKVHVQFKDFDRRMMRRLEFRRHRWTSAQLGQFAWPPDKQREWAGKFSKVVADAWTGKHAFLLDAPGTVRYRANCEIAVRHVDDPAEANTVIVAQWVPPGAPRLRSSVTGDRHGAELDARDTEQPTPEERQNNGELPRYTAVRQIGTFAPNSDDITDVAGPIADFVSLVRRLRAPGEPLAGPKEDVNLTAEGRADATGQARHNVALAARRADNVMQKVAADTGLDSGITIARGAYNATADPTFRRVDVFASTSAATRPAQVTAAHEAGHMFGLGDEYVDEAPQDKRFARRFAGERAGHQGDVQSTMGTEAADDMIVHDSDSIMSKGSEVKPGHYVYFLQALNTMTGESWTVG